MPILFFLQNFKEFSKTIVVTENIFQFILYNVCHEYIIQKNQPNFYSAFFIFRYKYIWKNLVNNQINQYNIKIENSEFGGKNEKKICDFFKWGI